ncbi:MAG: lipopolysaccharide assembly protein LapA domain-containing protein [Pseudomonadota bacterium]
MTVLTWIFRLWVLLLLTAFAIKNADIVTLKTFLGYEWQAPLVLILLVFFAGGVVIGFLGRQGKVFRLKRELAQLRKVHEQERAVRTETESAMPLHMPPQL